jgi:lactoylglutathione lyase
MSENLGRTVGSVHTGLHVADLERSLRFYVDLLGLVVAGRRVVDAPYVGELVGYPGAELHQAFLEIPGSSHGLELIEYRNVDKSAIDPRNADPGTAHICLLVDDVGAVCTRLRAAGVELLSEPVIPTTGPNVGRPAVYVKDPDGIRVELLQERAQ